MNQEQQAQIKARLEEHLAALQARLDKVSKEVTSEHSHDSAEQAQERENDEVLDGIGMETQHAVIQFQHALERLAQGEYGVCQECGEAISAGRLEAMPEATHCVNCAD